MVDFIVWVTDYATQVEHSPYVGRYEYLAYSCHRVHLLWQPTFKNPYIDRAAIRLLLDIIRDVVINFVNHHGVNQQPICHLSSLVCSALINKTVLFSTWCFSLLVYFHLSKLSSSIFLLVIGKIWMRFQDLNEISTMVIASLLYLGKIFCSSHVHLHKALMSHPMHIWNLRLKVNNCSLSIKCSLDCYISSAFLYALWLHASNSEWICNILYEEGIIKWCNLKAVAKSMHDSKNDYTSCCYCTSLKM